MSAALQDGNEAGGMTRGAPVIVLTYPYGGAARLRALLRWHPDLAWTSGTGILPLCEHAATAWHAVDGRIGQVGTPLPPLAIASIRTLATTLITSLLAQQGKRRWCEIAAAPPTAAETFLQLFPGARIVCLHRTCSEVGYAALHASSGWGVSGSVFAPFTAAYPASTAAALAAYWAANTARLLAFEQAHPEQCYRLRYEDLAAGPPADLLDFLNLEIPELNAQTWADGEATAAPSAGTPMPEMPTDEFPRPLLAEVHEMTNRLGYPAVSGST
jgi:protein-tyrosine sulfotransferase